jgi:hypothetical protein
MSAEANKLFSSPLPAAVVAVPDSIAGAIRKAAQATGASFDYLLAAAKVESNLDPKSSTRSSSATGLFQFIEQTWLGTVQQAGKAFGYGRYADAIAQTSSGRYVVNDPQMRSEVLALRKDPTAAAVMGGVFTQQNAAQLASRIGRRPTDGELYMAHFLGVGGAAKVVDLANNNPQANAATLFPAAAVANHSVFYDQAGNARSVAGVYGELTRRYQGAYASTAQAVASNDGTAANGLARSRRAVFAPDTAALASAYAGDNGANSPLFDREAVADGGPVFHSLFHTDQRRGPLSPAVSEFWGVGAERAGTEGAKAALVPAQPVRANPPVPTPSPVNTLELFHDTKPNVRALFDGNA